MKYTKSRWLSNGRIVLNSAIPEVLMAEKIEYGYKKTYQIKVYSEDQTRLPKDQFEDASLYFYQRLYSLTNQNSDPGTGDTWYSAARETKKWKPSRFPLTFNQFMTHWRGKGKLLGLTFNNYSCWFRIDLDDHNKFNRDKIKSEFELIYNYLTQNEIEDCRWFVEMKRDLTGIHFDFWFDSPIAIETGHSFLKNILDQLKVQAEIYPQNSKNCKLFGDNEYLLIADKIYKSDICRLKDYLTNENEYYEHPSINYVKDFFNFDYFFDNEIPETDKDVYIASIYNVGADLTQNQNTKEVKVKKRENEELNEIPETPKDVYIASIYNVGADLTQTQNIKEVKAKKRENTELNEIPETPKDVYIASIYYDYAELTQTQNTKEVKAKKREYYRTTRSRITNFFSGQKKHEEEELNEICGIVAKISLIQGFDASTIVERLLNKLRAIPIERTVSSFYKNKEKEQRKRIESIVNQAKRGTNETIVKSALSFKQRGINFLDAEIPNFPKDVCIASIYYDYAEFSKLPFSKEFNSILNEKIKPLLPFKMRCKASEIVKRIGILAKNQSIQNKPISYKQIEQHLKDTLKWKPRTINATIELIKALIEIKAIKKYKMDLQGIKTIIYYDIGESLSNEIKIPETTNFKFRPQQFTSETLQDYLAEDFSFIN